MEHIIDANGTEVAFTCNVNKGMNLVTIGTKGKQLKINIQDQDKYGLDFCAEDQYYDEDLNVGEDLRQELMGEFDIDHISNVRIM